MPKVTDIDSKSTMASYLCRRAARLRLPSLSSNPATTIAGGLAGEPGTIPATNTARRTTAVVQRDGHRARRRAVTRTAPADDRGSRSMAVRGIQIGRQKAVSNFICWRVPTETPSDDMSEAAFMVVQQQLLLAAPRGHLTVVRPAKLTNCSEMSNDCETHER